MEEIIIGDVAIHAAKLTVGKKTYTFYCKREVKEKAEAIRDDLIENGYDSIIRKVSTDGCTSYMVWWRKNP